MIVDTLVRRDPEATSDEGVLTIELHKYERAEPKRVAVKAVG